jgi:hypothetical protein
MPTPALLADFLSLIGIRKDTSPADKVDVLRARGEFLAATLAKKQDGLAASAARLAAAREHAASVSPIGTASASVRSAGGRPPTVTPAANGREYLRAR